MSFYYFILFLLLYLRQNLILKTRPAHYVAPADLTLLALASEVLKIAGISPHACLCIFILTCVFLLNIIILRFLHVVYFDSSLLLIVDTHYIVQLCHNLFIFFPSDLSWLHYWSSFKYGCLENLCIRVFVYRFLFLLCKCLGVDG